MVIAGLIADAPVYLIPPPINAVLKLIEQLVMENKTPSK